jgi:hypothetical protein
VVDGGKKRIILAALVTPADVMENTPMLDLLWRVRFRWKVRPRRAIGDTTYGTGENIRALEDAGIRAYVPLPHFEHDSPYFGQRDFTYDPERDIYTCPGEPTSGTAATPTAPGSASTRHRPRPAKPVPSAPAAPIAAWGGS